MTTTTLRRKKNRCYGIEPGGADYLALIPSGGAWLAAYYRNGNWVEDLATQTLTADPTVQSWAGFFADRYIVTADTAAIDVWDLDTDTVASYAAPGGWLIVGAGMFDGKVYWIEIAETWGGGPVNFTVQARLRQAIDPADLTTLGAVTTVSTHTLTDNFNWEWFDLLNAHLWFALNGTSAMAQRKANDAVNSEIWAYFRFRLPLNGGTTEDNVDAADADGGLIYGIPRLAGGSFDQAATLDDDVAAVLVNLWPAGAPWDTSVLNMSTTVDGSEVAAYGNIIGHGPSLTRSASSGPYTTPTAQFEVLDHPTEGTPSFFFIRG